LRDLGEELRRPPTARDIDEHKGRLPSKSLYWHTFGSLSNALREAGFDVPVGEERLERAVEQGVELARRLKRLPKFADWAEARKADASLMTEWQVYRMFDARRGGGSAFPVLLSERPRGPGAAGGPRRGRGSAPAAPRRATRSPSRPRAARAPLPCGRGSARRWRR